MRALVAGHVDALAGSIELQGLLVPFVVTPTDAGDGCDYQLVVGVHRVAAAKSSAWLGARGGA